MEEQLIQVKFCYMLTVKNETQGAEKTVRLKPNTYLHDQWEDVVRQLELKKYMKDCSISFLYPMKATADKGLSYFEFFPVDGDTIMLMNPMGAQDKEKKEKKEKKDKKCTLF